MTSFVRRLAVFVTVSLLVSVGFGREWQYEDPINCEQEEDPCATVKQGTCVPASDGNPAYCKCNEPYVGKYCEYNDEINCTPERINCGFGDCIRAGDGYPAFCMCNKGYRGPRCDLGIFNEW
jgi:hypothetical protein